MTRARWRRAGAVTWLLAATVTTGAGEASAQVPGVREHGAKVGCLRGRPLPDCKSFWIVEMQAHTPLAQTERTVIYAYGGPSRMQMFENVLEWNAGHMVNLTDRFALGGVATLGTQGVNGFSGLKIRARRWMSEDVAVELQAGLLRTGERYPPATGMTADLRLDIRDQGAFFVRWDGVPLSEISHPETGHYDLGGFQQALSVGVGLGSVPALVGSGALGLGYVILLGIFLGHAD